MNAPSWLLWGFLATTLLTTLMVTSQGLGVTRMSVPYLLGTMFTPSRDRAKILGFGVHLVNGWLFALVYVAVFQSWGRATWWAGAILGAFHAAAVLTIGMVLLPAIHPRMASEQQGPTGVRQLEPPGFLALHYGVRTPLSALVAHVVYGVVLGAFYQVR